jgi:hypothetical protein
LSLTEQMDLIVLRTSDHTAFAKRLPDDERVRRVARILIEYDLEMRKHNQLIDVLVKLLGRKR